MVQSSTNTFLLCYTVSRTINVKVRPYTMMAYGAVEVYLHSFLNLALNGSQWSASRCPICCTPTPRKNPRVVPEQEAGRAPHLVWTFFRRQRFNIPARQESNPGLSSLYGGQLTDSSILDMTIKIHDQFRTI